jgi:hypothetical protein
MIRASAPRLETWKPNLWLAATLSFSTILRLQNNRVSLLTHHHQAQKHTDSSMEIVSTAAAAAAAVMGLERVQWETYSLTCSNSFIQNGRGFLSLSLSLSLFPSFFPSNFGDWNQFFSFFFLKLFDFIWFYKFIIFVK